MAEKLRIYSGATAKEKAMVAAIERYVKARVAHSWMGGDDPRSHGDTERELRKAEAELMSKVTDGSLT